VRSTPPLEEPLEPLEPPDEAPEEPPDEPPEDPPAEAPPEEPPARVKKCLKGPLFQGEGYRATGSLSAPTSMGRIRALTEDRNASTEKRVVNSFMVCLTKYLRN